MGLKIVVAALAVWKVCQVLAYEDGPWDLMIRIRRGLYPKEGRDRLKFKVTFLQMLGCISCSSVWFAIVPAVWLGQGWQERTLLWLAIAALATILDHLEHFYYRSR
jgi:hypothetical protein